MSKLQFRQHATIPSDHFEALYTNNPDPWDYQTSAFEANKRSETIEALGGRVFQLGLELGCSVGVLTSDLAQNCETLVAADGSPLACDLARERLEELQNVEVLQARFPEDLDKLVALGPRDLIVLSEVLYFFSSADMKVLADYVSKALTDDGLCLVVNFDGDTQSGFSGVEANQLFAQLTDATLKQVTLQTYDGFQIVTYRPKVLAKG